MLKNFGQRLTSNLYFRQVQLPKPTLSSIVIGLFAGFLGNRRQLIASISGKKILHDLLGLLAVARKPLTISELSQILDKRQREINEHGIKPVRQFLLEADDAYGFYHVGFHDFVSQELLYVRLSRALT